MSANQEHLYILEPSGKKKKKYTCPQCGRKGKFTRYINKQTGDYLSDEVGICDRINNCKYHYPPRDYFRDHPARRQGGGTSYIDAPVAQKTPEVIKQTPPLRIDAHYLHESRLEDPAKAPLIRYMQNFLGTEETERLYNRYKLGSMRIGGEYYTIFWLIDQHMEIRSGKCMAYDPANGRRLKDRPPTWVHRILKPYRDADVNLQQCLFGEHLLADQPDATVAIVESEKTALLCDAFYGRYVWLATGGIEGFSNKLLGVLKGRRVVAFPDLQGYDRWQAVARSSPLEIRVFPFLERIASATDHALSLDLADFLD